MLGVRAVIAESFERIHRSNLIGMGILPLQFVNGENAQSLGITGKEKYTLRGFANSEIKPGQQVELIVEGDDDSSRTINLKLRIDSHVEVEYLRNGGILQTVLRQLLKD